MGRAAISHQGQRVLQALAQGRAFAWGGEQWRCGGISASLHVVCELERRKLVARCPAGLRLTPPGEAWCARQSSRRTGGPLRVLVERTGGGGTGMGRSVTVNLAESPLGWLAARGLISERQLVAGERLRDDWTRAGLAPRVTMRWDAAPTARRQGPADHGAATLVQIEAKRRFEAAMTQAGSGMTDILWRVACAGEGLAQAETALGWPQRSGKLVLALALDRIADFYRVSGDRDPDPGN